MGKNMILDKYLKHHDEANDQYDKAVILMQVGSFSKYMELLIIKVLI